MTFCDIVQDHSEFTLTPVPSRTSRRPTTPLRPEAGKPTCTSRLGAQAARRARTVWNRKAGGAACTTDARDGSDRQAGRSLAEKFSVTELPKIRGSVHQESTILRNDLCLNHGFLDSAIADDLGGQASLIRFGRPLFSAQSQRLFRSLAARVVRLRDRWETHGVQPITGRRKKGAIPSSCVMPRSG